MNPMSPTQRHADDSQHHHHQHHHSPVSSIKTLSPIPSPNKKQMVKSTSIVITSTSNECSPVHSVDGEQNKYVRLHKEITNAFQITPMSNMMTRTNQNDGPKTPIIKTISHEGSWRPFRRDKVTPLKVEDSGPVIHTYPSTYSVFSLESTKQQHNNISNAFINTNNTNTNDCCPDLIPKYQCNTSDTISPISNNHHTNNSPSSKSHFMSLLQRQETISKTDTSGYPFNTNNPTQMTSLDKSDAQRGSSELSQVDLSYLSVPHNGSWKNIEDSITLSTMPGSGSAISVARSLESKIKFSPLERSSFIVAESPIGSRSRNMSVDEYDVNGKSRSISCTITNLSTTQGRKWNAAMILLLSVAPIIGLLIQNCINLYRNNDAFYSQESVKSDILYSVEIGNVMHYTQIERGTTVLYAGTRGKDDSVNERLLEAYNNTDRAIRQLSKWLSENDPPHFRTEEAYWDRIKNFRKDMWQGLITDVDAVLKFYSDDNAVIERWIGKSVQLSTNGDLWRRLIGYYMLIISKEQAGVERALGGFFFAAGGFSGSRLREYLKRKVTGKNFLAKAEEYVKELQDFLAMEYRGTTLEADLSSMREEIVKNTGSRKDAAMAKKWFDDMTKYIDLLKVSTVDVL